MADSIADHSTVSEEKERLENTHSIDFTNFGRFLIEQV